jgi:predicted PurR-regulated permease PerM
VWRRDLRASGFILLGIAALVAALWVLSDIVLLVFGGVLVAVILHTIAEPVTRLGVWHGLSVLLAGTAIVVVLASAASGSDPRFADRPKGLTRTLPEAARRLLGDAPLRSLHRPLSGRGLVADAREPSPSMG